LETLNNLFQENELVLRMILIPIILIADTERIITRKVWERCYRKYRVQLRSGNVGIATCTRARVTNILHELSQVV